VRSCFSRRLGISLEPYSAILSGSGEGSLVWIALGCITAFGVSKVPKEWIRRSVPALVWIAIILNMLTYVPGIGYDSGGARRWVEFFGLTFQPSELTRIVLVLYLARMLEKNEGRLGNFKDGLLPPLLIVSALVLTVYFQNDFSTAAYLLLIAMGMFFAAGVSRAAIGASAAAVILTSASMLLAKPYRLERLRSWFRPDEDPSGAGYQLLRARVSLERGGFWGRGLGRGEVKRGGLPAAHSDFVVAVLGEEAGLIGITFILGLFTLFAVKGWLWPKRQPTDFQDGVFLVWSRRFTGRLSSISLSCPALSRPPAFPFRCFPPEAPRPSSL
jgi:cell division protein FtsW